MNFPDSQLSVPAVTEKDLADISFAVRNEVDYLALSFVREAADIAKAREIVFSLDDKHRSIPIIAKIEKPQALEDIDRILAVADGIMVARGDLGVEVAAERVPLIQKDLIAAAIRVAKPVITATQMLESMTHSPRPTRAEASDVANAILDGTDAVMLSAETASGQFPVEAVRTMNRIAEWTEASSSLPIFTNAGRLTAICRHSPIACAGQPSAPQTSSKPRRLSCSQNRVRQPASCPVFDPTPWFLPSLLARTSIAGSACCAAWCR